MPNVNVAPEIRQFENMKPDRLHCQWDPSGGPHTQNRLPRGDSSSLREAKL